MNHWLIVPVVLPAFMGALIVLWMRENLFLQRVFGVAGSVALLLTAIYLNVAAASGVVDIYLLSNWTAPFGILLMLDRLAAIMLLLTGILALAGQLYAIGSGWDRKGSHFHALWMFQLMGVNGAFLTGDAFNLFVFFEILLIASYGLMIHGGGAMRLRAGVQYISYNLVGSALFLAALGTLYSVTGTLNMADMAARVAELPPEGSAMLRTGAVLLLLVFAVKAAIVPLHFWLPSTYANAPGPVAALFAIMSKVGIYAIIRFCTLVFPPGSATDYLPTNLILPAALMTLTLGQLGVLGTRSLPRLAAFASIASIGTLLIAIARFTPEGLTAGLYYMLHSTLIGASLFLIADLISTRRGGDIWLRLRPNFRDSGLISVLFFVAAIGAVGLPPLSGFLGKLMILAVTQNDPWVVWIWSVVLVTSVFALVGFARAGSLLFWKPRALEADPGNDTDEGPRPARHPDPTPVATHEIYPDMATASAPWLAFSAVGALLVGTVVLTVFAGPITGYLETTAQQLTTPALYIDAVMNPQEGTK